MTNLEIRLLAVVQEMERCYGERDSKLNERLIALTKELAALSEELAQLGTRVNILTEQLKELQTGSRASATGPPTNRSSKSTAS